MRGLAVVAIAVLIASCGPKPTAKTDEEIVQVTRSRKTPVTTELAPLRSPTHIRLPTVGLHPTHAPTATLGPKMMIHADTTYLLEEERLIGAYMLQLWRNPEGHWTDKIATLGAAGQVSVQIEYATGFGELTGTDLTGEGHPDVVIQTYSGGAHCCFATLAYDLGPTLSKVLETPQSNCSGRFQDLDGDGVFEFVTCDDLFAYVYCSFASSPAVRVIFQYVPGIGYVPAGPRFKEFYAEDIAGHTQQAEQGKPGEMGEWDGTNKCSVLPVVLDYLYSGDAQQAWAELHRLYSYDDVGAFRTGIAEAVNKSPLYVPE